MAIGRVVGNKEKEGKRKESKREAKSLRFISIIFSVTFVVWPDV